MNSPPDEPRPGARVRDVPESDAAHVRNERGSDTSVAAFLGRRLSWTTYEGSRRGGGAGSRPFAARHPPLLATIVISPTIVHRRFRRPNRVIRLEHADCLAGNHGRVDEVQPLFTVRDAVQ